MVIMLFACMEILYAHARKGLDESVEPIGGQATDVPTRGRHAA